MTITKTILQKQYKDLHLRLQNQAAKFEIKAFEYEQRIEGLKSALATMPGQIAMLQDYIAGREAKIDSLAQELAEAKKENLKLKDIIEKLKLAFQKLKSRFKKDSSNSDTPPSTNVFKKLKPQSMREKSGKKPGGQLGHTGHGPKLFEAPTSIIEKKPCTCGCCGGTDFEVNEEEYSRRQIVDLTINIDITEERVFSGVCPNCGNVETPEFDGEFRGPMQYGTNVRALISMLGAYGAISDAKAAEILNSLSGDIFNISAGTVVNIRRELSERLEETINIIRERLILSEVLCGDESGVRVNGNLKWGQVFCNGKFALFGINSKRGEVDESIGILALFTGILIHDHFISYYKFKTMTHAECNQHILRYLKGLFELFKHEWFSEMTELLKTMCHEKNELLRAGKNSMAEEAVEEFTRKYDEILERGWAEYKDSTQGDKKKEKYYSDERCLLTRLQEYKKEHLLFISDFNVPFTNNSAEQGVRGLKVKAKVSGGFRSEEGAIWYMRIMSLIISLKKQKMVVFDGIRSVFLGQVPFSSA